MMALQEAQRQLSEVKERPRVLYVNSGSCNGCDIELLVAFTQLQERGLDFEVDVEARESSYDVLVVTGPVTAQSFCRLARMIRHVGGKLEVKYVVLLGSCACSGGIWYDSYATLGGFDTALRYLYEIENVSIDVRKGKIYITGCPVRPEDVASVLGEILNLALGR